MTPLAAVVLLAVGIVWAAWLILTDWWDSSHGPGIDRELRQADPGGHVRLVQESDAPGPKAEGITTNKEHTP